MSLGLDVCAARGAYIQPQTRKSLSLDLPILSPFSPPIKLSVDNQNTSSSLLDYQTDVMLNPIENNNDDQSTESSSQLTRSQVKRLKREEKQELMKQQTEQQQLIQSSTNHVYENGKFPFEILSTIFKHLPSWELVLARSLCSQFKTVADDPAFWHSVILPPRPKTHLKLASFEFFNERSKKTQLVRNENGEVVELIRTGPPRLKEISIHVGVESNLFKPLCDWLLANKASLVYVHLAVTKDRWKLMELSKKDLWEGFPEMIEYRAHHKQLPVIVDLKFRSLEVLGKELESDLKKKSQQLASAGVDPLLAASKISKSKLRVLWLEDMKMVLHWRHGISPKAPISLQRLTSLRIEKPATNYEWNHFLSEMCHTLKHLEFTMEDSSLLLPRGIDVAPAPLIFSKLQVLKLKGRYERFPGWMKVKESLILVTYTIFIDLPPISELWVKSMKEYKRIEKRCPSLKTLRYCYAPMKEEEKDWLNEFVFERQLRSQTVQIDGKKVGALKTLVVPFASYEPRKLELLEDVVDELLDLESVPQVVEVEI